MIDLPKTVTSSEENINGGMTIKFYKLIYFSSKEKNRLWTLQPIKFAGILVTWGRARLFVETNAQSKKQNNFFYEYLIVI